MPAEALSRKCGLVTGSTCHLSSSKLNLAVITHEQQNQLQEIPTSALCSSMLYAASDSLSYYLTIGDILLEAKSIGFENKNNGESMVLQISFNHFLTSYLDFTNTIIALTLVGHASLTHNTFRL